MAKRKQKGKPDRRKPRDAKGNTAGSSRGPWPTVIAVGALLLVHYLLAITSIRHKSNTYDEIAHLTRGYSYFLADDFRLGPPHPPLAHYWAALPGLGLDVKFPPELTPEENRGAWNRSDMWEIGRQFFYYRNLGNDAQIDSLLFRGRAMIALLSVGLGLVGFIWSRKLFGPTGGLITLALFAFSPTMLAHARLVTTDCIAAFFFLCSLGSIWWMLQRVTPGSVIASTVSLAGLFLAKLSAVLIIPVGAILLLIRLLSGQPLLLRFRKRERMVKTRFAQLGCFMAVMVFWIAVVYASIWAAYGFRYKAMAEGSSATAHLYTNRAVPDDRTLWEHVLRGDDISDSFRDTIYWLRDHCVFPEAYVYSAAYSRQTARGRMAFLDGELDIRGFAGFFPMTFLYKTPLPLFGMLLLALAAPWMARRDSVKDEGKSTDKGEPTVSRGPRDVLYQLAPLAVFLVVYWTMSIRSNLNIGHRHILPTYPVLFILCGAAGVIPRSAHRAIKALPIALLALLAAASLWTYPNYLTYFNTIAGGPDGAYRHLVDSSLDWGQDLPGLGDYLTERKAEGFSEPIYVSYFGSGGAVGKRHFGVEGQTLPGSWPKDARGDLTFKPGLYAISVTNLQQVYTGLYDWTEKNEVDYQALLPTFESAMAAPNTAQARKTWTTSRMQSDMKRFLRLRFARLCAYLREQEPDHSINHTILIYDLDADELTQARTWTP
jgi:hypothetical protein